MAMVASAQGPVSGSGCGADEAMKPDNIEHRESDYRSSNERPAWITSDLVVETVRVWSSRSKTPLSEQDAVDLILHFAHLLDATGLMRMQEKLHEAVPRSGSGQQS